MFSSILEKWQYLHAFDHPIVKTQKLISDPKPVVQSSFVTEFHDHIFVAMDAEAVLFLHDLVSSYLKEKDRGEKVIRISFE